MRQLWYNSDEVNCFHPLVEETLKNALKNCGYNNIAEVIHHPTIPNSTIIPDFAIRLKTSQRFIFVVEVKRTQRDVDSQRYQHQTRSYVTDFSPYWEPNYHKYFCITNIEKLILLADRQGPLISCSLTNNPKQHTSFNPINYDATATLNELQATFENIFPNIFKRIEPEWNNNWELIINSFHKNYLSLKNLLPYPTKEITLYELFRLLAYTYLKDYYTIRRSPNASSFSNYPRNNATLDQFRTFLTNTYNKIIQLDFKQIFSDHPNQNQRIFPNNLSENQLPYFLDMISYFVKYSNLAVAANSSPSYVFNLLTSKIYDRDELNRTGKAMTDAELANLLAILCIDSSTAKVLDPCCGDGALLDAAYDQIHILAMTSQQYPPHNQILSQLDGIEIDPFLAQLATFRILSKNLIDVNNKTEANIIIGDMFENPRSSQYDVILMNPPFLRNDNPDAPITANDSNKMISAIREQNLDCFVSKASQPNLYFYFTNFIWHYLKDKGKTGIILMAKFLNNEDGEYLKQFILDKVETIISYPRKYFQGFVVTTVIVILKKGDNSPNVSFVRISDENILSNPDSIKSILSLNIDSSTPSYKLTLVPRNKLIAADNWRQYLHDKNYDTFLKSSFLVPIDYHFTNVSRGGAENNGGSTLIFPDFDGQLNQYYGYGKRIQRNSGATRTRINIPSALNNNINYGIQNNFARRNYILTLNDLNLEKAFHFPSKSDRNSSNALPKNHQANQDLISYFQHGINEFGFDKWRKIVNSAFNNTFNPKIIIPRADRTKHSVYYNPHNNKITLSTNFFYCINLQNKKTELTDEVQYKFITAFLLSVFGQIQFEINSNNQEGLRKLEGFHIKKFKLLDLMQVTEIEINSVVTEFDILNNTNSQFSGDEGLNTPRRNLDLAIAKIVFHRNTLGFTSIIEMVDYFELFLADLVEDRRT